MRFLDLSQDTKSLYTLNEPGTTVFFLGDRSGEIIFELVCSKARAYIYSLSQGRDHDTHSLRLTQKHSAPDTFSQSKIKSTCEAHSCFEYRGSVLISPKAERSDASQECRVLLLSPDARVTTEPHLEILADNVTCRHAATTSPLSDEALFFLRSRGLSKERAQTLLKQGFFQEIQEELKQLGANEKFLSTISESFSSPDYA